MNYDNVNLDEIRETIISLIDSNEELSQMGKFIITPVLTKVFDKDTISKLLDAARKAGHNANDVRIFINDNLMRCRNITMFDDIIPDFCYIGEREQRWRDINIITDIYNEVKVMIVERYGVSEPVQQEEPDYLRKYYDASFLSSIMDSIIDGDKSLSQTDAIKLKERVNQHIFAIPQVIHILLESCPYTLDNIDEYDKSTVESDDYLIHSLAEEHPEDSLEFRNKFAQVYNQGIKELLRNYLTDKEQNKGEN